MAILLHYPFPSDIKSYLTFPPKCVNTHFKRRKKITIPKMQHRAGGRALLLLLLLLAAGVFEVAAVPWSLVQWNAQWDDERFRSRIISINVARYGADHTVVIALDRNGLLQALNGTSGEKLWSRNVSPWGDTVQGPWIKEATSPMYLVAVYGRLFSYSPLSGVQSQLYFGSSVKFLRFSEG